MTTKDTSMTARDQFEYRTESSTSLPFTKNNLGQLPQDFQFPPSSQPTQSADPESEKNTDKRDSADETASKSFDTAQPHLTMQQAAAFLGKSVRSLERSLLGRWGNKLPDGWSAHKISTENADEWRIVPPSGFRLRARSSNFEAAGANINEYLRSVQSDSLSHSKRLSKQLLQDYEHGIEQKTIIIDNSQEVENLLRELLATQKALSEERRLHMENLRIIANLQGHMRLLEASSGENARSKSDLEQSRRELDELKKEYNQIVRLPWWKRLLGFGFKQI